MDKTRYIQIRRGVDLSWSSYALFNFLFQDIVLILASYFLVVEFSDSILRFFAVPILSILMFRNFSQMHEAVHRLVSKKTWVNHLIGTISGAICLLPFSPWRHIHLQHHIWSGNIDQDPVTAIIRRYPKWPSSMKMLTTVLWHVWIPIFAAMQYFVFWFHSAIYVMKNLESPLAIISVVSTAALWMGVIHFLPHGSFISIAIPAVVLYFVAVEVVNLPHHLRLPQFHGNTKLPVYDQHIIARTCIYPAWISKFIVLNFNFHSEHHMFPDVPWYLLPKLHDVLKTEMKDELNLDPQFAWILENRPRTLGEVLAATPAKRIEKDTELKNAA